MKKLTEQTLIPISLVITIIGGVVWLTNIDAKASKVEALENVVVDIAEIRKDIEYIRQTLDKNNKE